MLLQLFVGVVDVLVSLVFEINDLLSLAVALLGSFGLLDHAVNIAIRETTARSNSDVLGLAGRLVFGGNIQDAVGVNIKGDFNLWVAARSHRDTRELKVTELLVVLGKLTLSLEDGNSDLSLVVSGGGEDLGFLCGNCGVPVDQASEDASHSLDTKGQRCHVEQEDILDVTSENGALDGSTYGDGLVGVDRFVGLFVEEMLHDILNLGHSCRATN